MDVDARLRPPRGPLADDMSRRARPPWQQCFKRESLWNIPARCLSASPHTGPDTPSAASSWSGTRQVLYSITKHAMRRSADEVGATSISFRPKVFSDATSVVDGIFSAHRVAQLAMQVDRVHKSCFVFLFPRRSSPRASSPSRLRGMARS